MPLLSLINDDLDELLVCKICQKYFQDPVLLPCGENICKEHVVLNKSPDEKEAKIYNYMCQLCKSNHQTLEAGFCLNTGMIKLLKLNYHLDENALAQHKLVEELDSVVKALRLICKAPNYFISEYASEIRNRIDVRREELLLRVHSVSNRMLNELKEFEDGCLRENRKNDGNDLMAENQLELDKLERQIEAWKSELRTPRLDSDRMKELLGETRKYLSENQQKLSDYKSDFLDGKRCYFESSQFAFDDQDLGQFFIFNQLQSVILAESQSIELINLCEFDSSKKFNLLYRATVDGFGASDFHSKCDRISKTLTIIQTKENLNIFGGYTESTWDGNARKVDSQAFIFSLVNSKDKTRLKMRVKEGNESYAIFANPYCGPTFGDDICIELAGTENTNNYSYSDLGKCYSHPMYQHGTVEARCFLAGFKKFMIKEIEVFECE